MNGNKPAATGTLGTAGVPAGAPAASPPPVIIDLGEKSRKNVKRLKRGEGRLLAQVQQAIQELQAAGRVAANAQPVIVVVEREPKGIFGW
jgi:hypothetical protein